VIRVTAWFDVTAPSAAEARRIVATVLAPIVGHREADDIEEYGIEVAELKP